MFPIRASVLVVALVLLSACRVANPYPQSLQLLLEAKSKALVSNDTNFWASFLHDEFSYINSLGQVLNKTTYIAQRRARTLQFISQQTDIVQHHRIGQLHYVLGNIHDVFVYQEDTIRATYRTTQLFIQSGKRFQWFSGQVTYDTNASPTPGK